MLEWVAPVCHDQTIQAFFLLKYDYSLSSKKLCDIWMMDILNYIAKAWIAKYGMMLNFGNYGAIAS